MWVYILRCGNGDFYTGLTTDLSRRLTEHQSRQGGRFTKMLQPVELVYKEFFASSEDAKRRESQLKTWSRAKKLALITNDLKALREA